MRLDELTPMLPEVLPASRVATLLRVARSFCIAGRPIPQHVRRELARLAPGLAAELLAAPPVELVQ